MIESETNRNFRLGVLNGVLFTVSETLLDPTLVIVAFLSTLTQSPLLLGLVVPIRDGAWALPQLWLSGSLQNMPLKITLYRQSAIIRTICWGLIALTINLVKTPNTLLIVFFGVYFVSSLVSGIGGLPFLEVVAKVVPPLRRGEFFAWRLGLGGLCSIGASFFVRWVLDSKSPFQFPYNFGLLSGLSFALASISLIFFCIIREKPDETVLPRQAFHVQIKRGIGALQRDANYRRFVIMQSTMVIAGSAVPFFAIFTQQSLGGSTAMVGIYLAILTCSNLFSNLFLGRMSKKIGNRNVMIVTVGVGMLMTILVFLLSIYGLKFHISGVLASWLLAPIFILVGLRSTGFGVSSNSLLLDIAPPQERSLFIGFTNSFMGLALLSTGISGVIVRTMGFQALLGFTLIAHILALVSVIRIEKYRV